MADRLTDLDHVDALATLRNRVAALECAIEGLNAPKSVALKGVQQLADDVAHYAEQVHDDFEAERNIRLAERGGARG